MAKAIYKRMKENVKLELVEKNLVEISEHILSTLNKEKTELSKKSAQTLLNKAYDKRFKK